MASNHRLADIRIADTFARGAYDPHTEAAEPTGWRANHIEETIRSIAAPRRAPPEGHAASARRRSHNSFVRPPPIHWRADRHRGRLDQPESAQPRLAIALSIRLPSQGWEARSRWCRS
jgi:hypothetical protein